MSAQPEFSFLDGSGTACATLTPLVHKAMRNLAPGERLRVQSDDPAAREGLPAWCRVTGHQLIETRILDAQRTEFLLQHK